MNDRPARTSINTFENMSLHISARVRHSWGVCSRCFFICLLRYLFSGCFFKHAFPAVSDWKQSKPLIFKLQIRQRWIKNLLKLLYPDHFCSKDNVSYTWYRCALEFINTHRGEVHSVIAPHTGVQSVGSKDR